MDKIVRNPRLGESTTGANLGQINGCMFSLLDEMHAVHFYVDRLSAVVVVFPPPLRPICPLPRLCGCNQGGGGEAVGHLFGLKRGGEHGSPGVNWPCVCAGSRLMTLALRKAIFC